MEASIDNFGIIIFSGIKNCFLLQGSSSQYLFADPAESTEIRSDAVQDGFTGTAARYAFIQTPPVCLSILFNSATP
jgi:hypothetical protein